MEIVEEIFKKTTEEYKAMKWLKDKIDDCNDDCLTINYNMILYYLVINLLKKNKQLETNRDEAIEYIKEHIKYECDDAFNGMEFYSYHLYDFSNKKLLSILERGKE